ncbi:16S rRNA (cytosine1402-N4)-methyltransferase [Mycoplasma testudineum]|uniref:Ribosomal RNA small subunit methyltransferase H n=1 Tax=Mycoplasma testudineum TaxID=244584 RepID=A0A4V3C3A0_9MOLU|nr:16S rRNA (cytosine(1402)-N(4))-methyltransferase RsmH [Mycoplasma testudineum]TDO21159.1 16S rRNA (cytosine1402-N4)-methyltransferase [Mycoplasma testudineum]
MDFHKPVLLEQVLDQIDSLTNKIFVDATIGYAGHSAAILNKNKKLKLIGFDQDDFAIKNSKLKLAQYPSARVFKSNFRNFDTHLQALKIDKVDYFLADLGISSVQVDFADRGFSYNKDGPLDMRMNQEQNLTAHSIINNATQDELVRIFTKNADVKLPKVIAKAIVENRPLNSTLELVDLIRKALPAKLVRQKNHAKTVFQALRIEVNDEFSALQEFLTKAIDYLPVGGKLMIISFHSAEDKIIKDFFKNLIQREHDFRLPIIEEAKFKAKTYNPTNDEITNNKRSRSAKLRVLTKLKN